MNTNLPKTYDSSLKFFYFIGVGLGLVICKKLIGMIGNSNVINVESEIG